MSAEPIYARAPNAALILADGKVFVGTGFGKIGKALGEVCFNTAITGYQEVMTDPSYSGQIVAFTAPHVGNVGANDEDIESYAPRAAKGAIGLLVRAEVTSPSNWRSTSNFDDWCLKRGITGLSGIDTRALTHHIRENGMAHGIIIYDPANIAAILADKAAIATIAKEAKDWTGLEGADLAKNVTSDENSVSERHRWDWHGEEHAHPDMPLKVVVMDFGVKDNILRCLANIGAVSTIVPADASAEEILALKPHGVLLSNGPGDPAATGTYAAPQIKALVDAGLPVFGICLGHQMLGLALGGTTVKMAQGHHGANHPVKDLRTGKVEIVSMNHGFALDADSLGQNIDQTHVSLFDGSNCGIALKDKPVFSVQYHPEASPGPQDSFYLFEAFGVNMAEYKGKAA